MLRLHLKYPALKAAITEAMEPLGGGPSLEEVDH